MKNIEIKDLDTNELLLINGGDKFLHDVGYVIGQIGAGIYSFMLGVREGGYANCKCP